MWSSKTNDNSYRSEVISLLREIRDLLNTPDNPTEPAGFACGRCGKVLNTEHGLKVHQGRCKEVRK